MYKPKTAISLALLAATVASISCSSGASGSETTTEPSNETTTVEVVKTRLDELGERDFEGREFRILATGESMNVPGDEANGEVINDALYNRDQKINNLYNTKITYILPSDATGNTAQMVRQAVLGGDDLCELVIDVIPDGKMGTLATSGLLANLSDINWLTLDANWWSPLVYENCNLGGKVYYTCGDIAPFIYRGASCYYANKKLLTEYSIEPDTIYDAVDEGKWTLDYMNKLAGELDRDLNGDTNIDVDNDFFGILNEDNQLTAAAFMSASGIKLSTNNPDNTLTVDLNNERTIAVIEKLKNTLSHVPYNGQNIHEAFKADRVVFLMHYTASSFARYRDMESDFMMLPMPKYEEAQESYISLVNTYANAFVGIPTNADTDFAGFVAEALAYESRQTVRPGVYDLSFKEKGARDERAAEVLDLVFDTLYLDFNSFMGFGGSVNAICNAIFKETDFVSSYSAITNSIATQIESFAESWLGEN